MFKEKQKIIEVETRYISLPAFCTRSGFDERSLSMLRDSILSVGIINPLLVREASGGRYILITGERRLIAAKMAGLKRVPCTVKNVDEFTANIYALSSNIQKSNLHFFEEAAALERLCLASPLSHGEIAERLGISEARLKNRLRLMKISEVSREKIIAAGLTLSQVYAVLKLPAEIREEAFSALLSEESAEQKEMPKQTSAPKRKAAIGDPRIFGNSLEKMVDTLSCAGFTANLAKTENGDYIEYNVRLSKRPEKKEYYQLPFC